MNTDAVAQRLALAISQSKSVEREARNLKQTLAALRDDLQAPQPKEAQVNGSTKA